jgi:hypothetical protein
MFAEIFSYLRCGFHSIKIKTSGSLNKLIYTSLSVAVEVTNIARINCNSGISYPLDCSQDGAKELA